MKDFLTKYFGVLGLVIYFILAVVARIPVAVFLLVYIFVVLIVAGPFTKDECCPSWVNRLYDWYCNK